MRKITASKAAAMFHAGGETAFLDLREAGQFGESHPLFAIPLPYSVLELRVRQLVPRRDTPILLLDNGDGIAKRGAARLARMGYGDQRIIEGGMPAWAEAGLGVYKGVNVPSKLLGELAEAIWHPQMITAPMLSEWRRSGCRFRFFDARPPVEYATMRVPGAVCLPNGELAHRAATFEGMEADPVVITCAGRTRGIVGAIGMRLAGYPGKVLALENGTQGWALAGETLERGQEADIYPALTPAALERSREGADNILSRFGLPEIDTDTAAAMLQEEERTTYLLDTRSPTEARNDPVSGAINAPAGQLAQATDQWIGTFRARLILCCDTGLRSALAGFWLAQMGYDVQILRLEDGRATLPAIADGASTPPGLRSLDAEDAVAAMRAGAALIDLRPSMRYRAGHVKGAFWSSRPGLPRLPAKLRGRAVVMIADDAARAAYSAQDLRDAGIADISLVRGGHEALEKMGAAVVMTPDDPTDADCIDHLFFVHDRHHGNLDASRKYLEWETGLVTQLSPRERNEYRLFHP